MKKYLFTILAAALTMSAFAQSGTVNNVDVLKQFRERGNHVILAQYDTMATGDTITLSNLYSNYVYLAADTVAAFMVKAPAAPNDGQVFKICTQKVVDDFQFLPGSGQTVANAPAASVAGECFTYIYRKQTKQWNRFY